MAVETIGRYRVIGEVGAGGFATVYRAHDPVLDRELAIKLLHPHLARDPQLRMRFVREGRALARIRHPNIVQVHDAGETDGTAYLAMEFIEGASLATIAARQPLTLGDITSIVRQVAGALDALHAGGLVHRDVKPANILVEQHGRTVLLDLGVAHSSDATAATTSGLIVGTPGFLAPEQVEPRVPVSPATDVYQLAATVHTLLAGRPPFEGDTVQVLYAVVHREPPDMSRLRPDLPPHVIGALAAGMAKDPALRPRRATDFAAILEGAGYVPATPPPASSGPWQSTGAGGSAGQAPPSGPTPPGTPHPWIAGPPPTQASSHKQLPDWWPAALAGVAAVVLLVAAILVLTAGGSGGEQTPTPQPSATATRTATGRAAAAFAITLSPTPMPASTPARASAETTTATATAPPPTAAAATCDWAGSWKTSYGTLALRQTGTSVTGSYRYTRDGTLEGTLEGNVLRGQWVEKPLANERQTQPNQFNGDFEFTIDTGCGSFAGRWRYGSEGAWDTWLGVRQ